MIEKTAKWNFGLIDALMTISIVLVGWNLSETIKLKEELSVQQGTILTEVAKGNSRFNLLNLRVDFLEREASQGKRCTYGAGQELRAEVRHNRKTFEEHTQRTEPQIREIHDVVVPRVVQ